MLRVLGIDPGSRVTGYGIVGLSGNRLVHIEHGTINAKPGEKLPSRLKRIHDGLLEVVQKNEIHESGVEMIFNARNAQSALKLGHARGVILLALEESSLPITEYTPMQVKSAVVGYGKATKEQVQEMVKRLLALPKKASSDASDALAVAICHGRSRTTAHALMRGALRVRR
ncbi:MAG: crossover junction endodeoxyribonuclease RuvC [Deltaproteobacteria bacterium]|nr:MAG: crossover junction endodeoxyribonuclease RuvC [Deltaproteobacteria bacterium]